MAGGGFDLQVGFVLRHHDVARSDASDLPVQKLGRQGVVRAAMAGFVKHGNGQRVVAGVDLVFVQFAHR